MINKAFPMETTENHISGWEKSTSDGPEPKTLPSVDTYWSVLKRGKDLVGLKLRKNNFVWRRQDQNHETEPKGYVSNLGIKKKKQWDWKELHDSVRWLEKNQKDIMNV